MQRSRISPKRISLKCLPAQTLLATAVVTSALCGCSSSSAIPAPPSARPMSISRRQPTNDAAALTALQAMNPKTATSDLRAAISSSQEPARARVYARQALDLIGKMEGRQAGMPAEKGACVEYLAWALADLNVKDPASAADQLKKAAKLPSATKAATAALGAIKAHEIARSVMDLHRGLKTLGG